MNDEVVETIDLEVFSTDRSRVPRTEYAETLSINEYRFLNLIQYAKYRDQKLLSIAEELMLKI